MCCILLCSFYLHYEDMKMNNQEGYTRTENNVFLVVRDRSI